MSDCLIVCSAGFCLIPFRFGVFFFVVFVFISFVGWFYLFVCLFVCFCLFVVLSFEAILQDGKAAERVTEKNG